MSYGCLFCRSGSEERIIRDLRNIQPALECLSPKRVRIRRKGERETVSLFPGYIFFKTHANAVNLCAEDANTNIVSPSKEVDEATVDFRTIVGKTDVYRLLRYPNGDWALKGSDLHLAMLLFEWGGIVKLSRGKFTENGVKMISGPLFEYESCITKIDKRAKTARVTIDFHGEKIEMWLGFEIGE